MRAPMGTLSIRENSGWGLGPFSDEGWRTLAIRCWLRSTSSITKCRLKVGDEGLLELYQPHGQQDTSLLPNTDDGVQGLFT